MIGGLGTDIIEISRIQKAIEKNDRFLLKNFTTQERAYFEKSNHSYEKIAGNFAAKEAVSKALGTGFRGFGLSHIEILRDELGAPFVLLHEKAQQIAREKQISRVWVSISHCKAYAVAYAVAEISL